MKRTIQGLVCLGVVLIVCTFALSSRTLLNRPLWGIVGDRLPFTSEVLATTDRLEPIVLPVVFHLNRSQRWQTPDSLVAVLAEVQRIFDRAAIEIRPIFSTADAGTEHIDVYLVPSIRQWGRSLNGISFGRARREIFVRDDVVLNVVDDRRPLEPLSLPKYWPEDSTVPEKVSVDRDRAEQARTIAHEITHQLGLVHVRDPTNLQASGTTGWQLTTAQVRTMRQIAMRRWVDADRLSS